MKTPSPQLQTLKAQFFRALAHPIRIRLLEEMRQADPPRDGFEDLDEVAQRRVRSRKPA